MEYIHSVISEHYNIELVELEDYYYDLIRNSNLNDDTLLMSLICDLIFTSTNFLIYFENEDIYENIITTGDIKSDILPGMISPDSLYFCLSYLINHDYINSDNFNLIYEELEIIDKKMRLFNPYINSKFNFSIDELIEAFSEIIQRFRYESESMTTSSMEYEDI